MCRNLNKNIKKYFMFFYRFEERTMKDIKNFDGNKAKKICHFPGWDISSSYIAAPLNGGDLVEHLYKRNTKLDYLCFIFLTAPTMKSTENLFCSQKLAINVFGLHAHFNNCPSQNFFLTFFFNHNITKGNVKENQEFVWKISFQVWNYISFR